ncbi:hypothetical protein BHM03_00014059 [Ensete ventricosum]|nr:hypothetical protein BHM03_00014059 [Ensete ventricosum]
MKKAVRKKDCVGGDRGPGSRRWCTNFSGVWTSRATRRWTVLELYFVVCDPRMGRRRLIAKEANTIGGGGGPTMCWQRPLMERFGMVRGNTTRARSPVRDLIMQRYDQELLGAPLQ